jgi:RNAse (barnase) inhibitor barstar
MSTTFRVIRRSQDKITTGGTITTLDASNGTNGTALTLSNIPSQSVTTGTGSTATFSTLTGDTVANRLWYRFTAAASSNSQFRKPLVNSLTQSFRGMLRTFTTANTATILTARWTSGVSWRIQQNSTYQIVLQDSALGVLWTSPALSPATNYEIAVDWVVGTTTTNGKIQIAIYPEGSNTPIVNAYFSSSAANMNTGTITHADVGPIDTGVANSRDVYWTNLQWQPDRTLKPDGFPYSLPSYAAPVVVGNTSIVQSFSTSWNTLSTVATTGTRTTFVPTGTDGTAFTSTAVPAGWSSVTGTAGTYFVDTNGLKWYRWQLVASTVSQGRVAVTSSLQQSFRGRFRVDTVSGSVARAILTARYSGGVAMRWVIDPTTRQLSVTLGTSSTTPFGTTSISGGLASGVDYDIITDYVVGSTTANGTVTLKVCNGGTDTAVAGGTLTLTGLNLNTLPIIQYDVGSNDAPATAMDIRWTHLQFENDRSSSIPVYVAQASTVPTSDYDIIVGFIQSNMRGRADDFDYPTTDFYRPEVYQWRQSDNTPIVAIEPAPVFENTPYMGPMNRFSRSYIDAGALASGRHLLIVNLAEGGTGVTLPDSNGGKETWWPSETDPAKVDLYARALAELQAVFAAVGTNSRIIGILANHGSTDGTNNTSAATFTSRVTEVINGARNFIYSNGMSTSPYIPYIMMQMRPSLLSQTPHKTIDDAQQAMVGTLPNLRYTYSPVGSAYEQPDSVHFNSAGVRIIGDSMYQSFAQPTSTIINQTYGFSWNVSAPVVASYSQTSNVAASITKSFAQSANTLSSVTKSFSTSWNTLSNMSVLASETWDGNAASWPAQWTVSATFGGSATTVNNQGRITAPTGTFTQGKFVYLSGMTPVSDMELLVDITTSTASKYLVVGIRVPAASGASEGPASSYNILFAPSDGSWHLMKIDASGTHTDLQVVPWTYSAATFTLRFQAAGTTIRAKVWNTGSAEPASWSASAIDSTYTAPGSVEFWTQSGSTGSETWDFDNLSVGGVAPTSVVSSFGTSWNVYSPVVKSVSESWNVLAPIASAYSETFNVASPVLASYAQSSQTLASTGTTYAETANVLSSVATTYSQSSNTLSSVAKTYSETFGVASVITPTSYPESFNVLTPVITQYTETFNTLSSVSNNYAQAFNVMSSVATSMPVSFNVLTSALKTLSQSFNVSAQVVSSISPSWNTLSTIGGLTYRQYTQSFNVISSLVSTFDTSWNVLNSTVAQYTETANVYEPIVKSYGQSFAVSQQVSQSLVETFNINSSVVTSLTTGWNVFAAIGANYSETFNVRQQIVKSLTETFNINSAVLTSYSNSYAVRQQIVQSLSETFQVANEVSISYPNTWNIASTVDPVTYPESYAVFQQIVQTYDQTFNVSVAGGVVSSYAQSYNVAANIGQSLNASWNVLSSVAKTMPLTWNTLSSVSPKAYAESFNTLSTVIKGIAESWNIYASITHSDPYSWNTLNSVVYSYTPAWNVNANSGVLSSFPTSWNTLSTVVDPNPISWNVTQSVATSLPQTFNVNQALTQSVLNPDYYDDSYVAPTAPTLSSSWNVAGSVVQSYGQSFNVRSSVSKSLAQTYNVNSSVQAAFTTSWTTVGRVVASFGTSWNVEQTGAVTQALLTSFNVRQSIVASFPVSWNVFTIASQSLSTAWNTKSPVVASLPVSWGVRGAVVASLGTSFNVRTSVLASLTETYNVRDEVVSSIDTSWNVNATSGLVSSFAFAWNVRSQINTSIDAKWNVLTSLSNSYSSSWNVYKGVLLSHLITWNVYKTLVNQIAFSWVVRSTVTADFDYKWDVYNSITRNLPLNWNVLTSFQKQLVIEWRVNQLAVTQYQFWWTVGVLPFYFSYWDGTKEIPCTFEGVWDGTTVVGMAI